MATAILLQPTTPLDYHRIISPDLVIPSDPQISIPVGIIACQRKYTDPNWSFLRQTNETELYLQGILFYGL